LVSAANGDVLASQSRHQLLDIYDVASPVVVEILTHRRGDSGLLWTFDQNLRSVYAEQSSLTVSRFRNVLDLAHAAGKPVPDEIYDLAFDSSRPDIALLAIRSMFISGHSGRVCPAARWRWIQDLSLCAKGRSVSSML